MKINKTTENNTIILAVEGRIDTTTAPQLEAEVKSSTESAECIVIDFSNVEYISSAGLRVLLMLKQMNDAIKLVKVSDEIYDIFDITGFADIFDIERK
jgi:anti-sigma B factor antagonist